MEKNKKFHKFILLISILLHLSGCMNNYDPKILIEMATRFQVTPSWDVIQSQLFNNEFRPGMTREEIHKVLDKVGPWTIDLSDPPDLHSWDSETNQYLFRENIHFIGKETLRYLSYWGFLYDKNDKLVRQGPLS